MLGRLSALHLRVDTNLAFGGVILSGQIALVLTAYDLLNEVGELQAALTACAFYFHSDCAILADRDFKFGPFHLNLLSNSEPDANAHRLIGEHFLFNHGVVPVFQLGHQFVVGELLNDSPCDLFPNGFEL